MQDAGSYGVPVALVVAAVAAYTDWRRGKVCNWLTVPAAALGLVMGGLGGGAEGLGSSLLGLLAGLAFGVLAAALGAPFGGGDTKLLAALGALGGPAFLLRTSVYGILAAGVLALGVALRNGSLLAAVKGLLAYLVAKFVAARPIHLSTLSTGGRIPFAVGLGVGCWLAGSLPVHWPV